MPRGDIHQVELPAPRGTPGREQFGRRPAIVVQTALAGIALPTTVIVPLTTNLAALNFPHTFQVDPSPQNGLTDPSAVLVFQLRAVDKVRLGRHLGRLSSGDQMILDAEIRHLLGL